MPRSLKLYIFGLVVSSAGSLAATSLVFSARPGWVLGIKQDIAILPSDHGLASVLGGVLFWILVALCASAMPVRMPRGTIVAVSIAPIVAAMSLGGPVAAGWVGAVGTFEVRELSGRVPWYGTLANHAVIVLPAVLGGIVCSTIQTSPAAVWPDFLGTLSGAGVFFVANVFITATLVALRTGQDVKVVALGDARGFGTNLFALAPLAWLMARIYQIPDVGWWATLLFALPLYTTRVAYHRFVEMREMFTQTIASLAQAVDKRDPFTSNHSKRVMQIATDIGRVMRLGEPELEALEWGGLLHDVGKIGGPDNILLKQERLTRDERMKMNAHPVLGAEIIAPVTKLAPELPIIRHHHEWYNGSGYPDRLIGDEIPKLARVLHVADAFEAMTAARPYRMKPLTAEQALGELRKFAGIQFDPSVVDAFVKTGWVEGVADPGGTLDLRPVPLIAQAAGSMSASSAFLEAGTGADVR